MRRLLVSLGSISLALIGTQAAHAVAYRAVEPSAEERAHLLAGTGHAYLEHATLLLAVLTVVASLALLSELRATVGGNEVLAPRLWMFGVVAPATFVVQEHFERWFHDGAFPWDAATHPTFLVGLILQIPFALAAYLLARIVLRAADAIAWLLRQKTAPRLREASRWPQFDAALPCSSWYRAGLGPRGPPLPSV